MRAPIRGTGWIIATVAIGLFTLPPSAFGMCAGDCNEDGAVSIDDLVKTVNVALSAMPMSACMSADPDSDSKVQIDEVVHAVQNSIRGCECASGGSPFRSTFEAIQKQVFERHGCTASICHGASPGQGGL